MFSRFMPLRFQRLQQRTSKLYFKCLTFRANISDFKSFEIRVDCRPPPPPKKKILKYFIQYNGTETLFCKHLCYFFNMLN